MENTINAPVPPILLLTDRKHVPGADLTATLARVAGVVDLGVVLGESDLTDRALFALARRVADTVGASRLFLVGRPDVARAAGAAGVVLAPDGLNASDVRAWWPDAVIGVACNSRSAALACRAAASFLIVGPCERQVALTPVYIGPAALFPVTVPGVSASLEERAGHVAAGLDLPWFATGGISQSSVDRPILLGASGVVTTGEVLFDLCPAEAALELANKIKRLKA